MRLLIAGYGPPRREHGGAQLALNLGEALRARGLEVVSWSTPEPPAAVRWWRQADWTRRQLERFAAETGPYDAIDLPPIAVSARLAATAPLVARSLQPDLSYFAAQLPADFASPSARRFAPPPTSRTACGSTWTSSSAGAMPRSSSASARARPPGWRASRPGPAGASPPTSSPLRPPSRSASRRSVGRADLASRPRATASATCGSGAGRRTRGPAG